MTRPRRKLPRWLKLLGLLGIAFVVCVGVPVYVWLFVDAAPFDDSDLLIERRTVAPEDNGFALVDFGEVPDVLRKVPTNMPFGIVPIGDRWDRAKGRACVEDAAPYLSRLERCLERADFLPSNVLRGLERRRNLMAWRSLAEVLLFRAGLAIDDGRIGDALRDFLRILDFGRRLQRTDTDITTYLVGSGIEGLGKNNLAILVNRYAVDESELSSLATRLAAAPPSTEDLRRAFAADYSYFRSALRSGVELARVLDMPPDDSTVTSMLLPNETCELLATRLRPFLEHLDAPPSDRVDPMIQIESRRILGIRIPKPLRNHVGHQVAMYVTFAYASVLREFDRRRLEHGVVLTLIALRRHVLDHGELPESLDALVPTYLDAVPKDPYDGQPLRYSKSKRRIWSIGEDGVDGGGLEDLGEDADTLLARDEPTVHIGFGGN